jgi:ketosteroid isomerase-like protein
MSTTTTSTHVGTVAEIYGAFGRGDVPFIMSCLADDIAWDQGVRSTDLPWAQPGTGKAHVGEFFTALGQGLALTTFDPQVMAGDGDNVVAVIREAGTILSTGNPVEVDLFVHLWKFNDDGKVASFRHIGDWARHEIPFKG